MVTISLVKRLSLFIVTEYFFPVVKTFEIYPQQLLKMQYGVINYTRHAVRCPPDLFYNWELYLDLRYPLCPIPHLLPLVTTNLWRKVFFLSWLFIEQMLPFLKLQFQMGMGSKRGWSVTPCDVISRVCTVTEAVLWTQVNESVFSLAGFAWKIMESF